MAAVHPPARHINRAASTATARPLQSTPQDERTLPKTQSKGVNLASKRGRFGVKKGSLWGRFGVGFFGIYYVPVRHNFICPQHLSPTSPHHRLEKLVFTPTPPR